MALTADQAELLQTTIENLNRSVEINNQVLELIKSVGNTGAVDIATHNSDKSAHPAFNNVLALQRIYCTPYTDGPDSNGALGGNTIRHSLNSSIQQLINRWNAWGCWGNEGAVAAVNLINGYGRTVNGDSNFAGKTVISMNAYGWDVSSGSNQYKLMSSIGLGQDEDGNGFCQLGLNDSSYGNANK